MGGSLDTVQDSRDKTGDKSITEPVDAPAKEVADTPADESRSVTARERNLANNAATALHPMETPSGSSASAGKDSKANSGTPSGEGQKLTTSDAQIDAHLKTITDEHKGARQQLGMREILPTLNHDLVDPHTGKPVGWKSLSEHGQKQIDKTIDENVRDPKQKEEFQRRLKIEARAQLELINSGHGSADINAAAERLRKAAGDNLPATFEDDLEEWKEFQATQMAATKAAQEQGLTNKRTGEDLEFPHLREGAKDMAAMLDNFAEAYERQKAGRLEGEAAKFYDSHTDEFFRDMESWVAMGLNPIREDFQGGKGTCAMNTQQVGAWIVGGKEMSALALGLMTEGEYVTSNGDVFEVTADRFQNLASNDTGGQDAASYLTNSTWSMWLYGQYHYEGNSVEACDDVAVAATANQDGDGVCVSNQPGLEHNLEAPSHSMLNLAIAGEGLVCINHWGQPGGSGWGGNEPWEGKVADLPDLTFTEEDKKRALNAPIA